MTDGADPASPRRPSGYARIRYRTTTGSVYELVRDERGMWWRRLSATMASGPLRGSGAWPLHGWPEVTIGAPVQLVGPPYVPGADVRVVYTTPVVEIIEDESGPEREPLPSDPVSRLTEAELAELRRGGLAPSADRGAHERVRARTAAQLATLLARTLSTAEAARRMGVDPRRVRQLLAQRRLLGVRDGHAWRILDVQFTPDGLVPNIGLVVAALPEGLPPLVAATWLHTPEPDLEVAGEPVAPIAWLTAGGDPERVRLLAADL